MSYRRSYSKLFNPAEFTVTYTPTNAIPPTICDVHPKNNCFRASIVYARKYHGGIWELKVPLDISSLMPGTKQKLLNVSLMATGGGWFGWFGGEFYSGIQLFLDDVLASTLGISFDPDKWLANLWEDLNIDISAVSKLRVALRQFPLRVSFPGGWLEDHVANIKIDFEYYTENPPVTSTVSLTVYNQDTSKPVNKAHVLLMSGSRIVADGYTNTSGFVTFSNVDEGSYTIKVSASGYHLFDISIDVAPPSVWYEIKIIPIPTTPLPWWVVPVVVGTIALGGSVVAYQVLKKPAPPVVVMR